MRLPCDFDAFGQTYAPNTSVTVEQRYQWTGRSLNPVSGLYNHRYRQSYDPGVGRFGQRDPIREFGGINLYTYAGNYPTIWTDPYGLLSPVHPRVPLPPLTHPKRKKPPFRRKPPPNTTSA